MTYVRIKHHHYKTINIQSIHIKLPTTTTTKQLINKINKLNHNTKIHNILLQHPIPNNIDERAAFEAIPPNKNVNNITIHNFKLITFNLPKTYYSYTAAGIIHLLKKYHIKIKNKHTMVIGHNQIINKPITITLLTTHTTITIYHSKTKNLTKIIKLNNIIITTINKPKFIKNN